MQFTLFTRTSDKTELQQRLDRDAAQGQVAALEELPPGTPHSGDSTKVQPLFGAAKKPIGVFRVDLLNDWQKP